MAQQKSSGERPMGGRFDPFCRVAYELALLVSVVTLALTALHGALTQHVTINHVIDATHVGAPSKGASGFKVGETYPLYRFHQQWQDPIGNAQVERIQDDEIVFRFDPDKMTFAVGRHGKILSVSGLNCRVDLGSAIGLKKGDDLRVFDGRTDLGVIKLGNVGKTESDAQITGYTKKIDFKEFAGKTASEYSIPTQAASFDSPVVLAIEVCSYVFIVAAYFALWWRSKGSPLLAVGQRTSKYRRPTLHASDSEVDKLANREKGKTGSTESPLDVLSWGKLAWLGLVGVPATWYASEFLLRMTGYLIGIVYSNFLHAGVPELLTYELGLQAAHIPLFTLVLIGYELFLAVKKRSPFKPFQDFIAFRGGIFGHTASDLPEHVTMFCFQAIIVYTFARTIGGFLHANLNEAIAVTWPRAPKILAADNNPFGLEVMSQCWQSIAYALSHAPHPISDTAMLTSLDYLIYDVCILVCLVGYGYSFVSYLWGKRIRNTDFTVVGWLTNGVCYGPLFAVVFWTMLPPVFGVDPTVTPGFLRVATFVVAVSMNAVYTLSIWNLGVLFGVMTDKGVRTSGFYSVVRHPNYTIESIMFVIFYCRELSTYIQWYAVCGFLFIYWLRSEREDQFMTASNPEYVEYKKQVPYKFIPGLY